MTLSWAREELPVWDAEKARIIGGAPPGALDLAFVDGQALPGDWFAATDGDRVVGYGWLDVTWGGDAEVLLAVDPSLQGQGIGSYVMDHVEREAASRGVNYVYNTVRDTHPRRDEVHDWLMVRGYRGNEGDASLRKLVTGEHPDRVTAAPARPAAELPSDSMPPGHEESGGYVDVDQQQY